MSAVLEAGNGTAHGRSRLTKQQIIGFFGCWLGWVMDGVDSFIFALVFVPSMRELLPASGFEATPANIAFSGSVMFGLFLIGWGMAFIWGPLGDKWGRARTLALTVVVYSVFTGAAALAQDVYQLAVFRFLAGIGVGGEWALAGTFIAEIWPEDRRARAGGYLQTGYYVGFFIASALNFTVGANYGWRVMFLCGLAPVVLAIAVRMMIKEPTKWSNKEVEAKKGKPLREIFGAKFRQRTIVLTTLLTCSIIGLWAGAVYAPAALTNLATKAGYTGKDIPQLISYSSMLFSFMTILGCLTLPFVADALGRRGATAVFFLGMFVSIITAFGFLFYRQDGLIPFIIAMASVGYFGGNFAVYSIWIPEQYPTTVRATAFAWAISFGRFVGAGVNFLLGWAVSQTGTLGVPVACTAIAFAIGIAVLPWAMETRGKGLPE
ncbi:MAG TPA: MFS transporter [Xanthobacteraceae bacterium]|jgi:MFS family permease|nr:MFS transporter [Xanthobacteraceae bacterium]